LAPSGYHVPSNEEWTTLSTYLNNNSQYWCNNNSFYIAKSLASKELWNTLKHTCSIGDNLNANNSSGFSGLPGGFRDSNGVYNNISYFGCWWAATEFHGSFAWSRYLYNSYTFLYRNYDYKEWGFSVRCIKD
jgi:uncharacterized protein (TIGR02145 family)